MRELGGANGRRETGIKINPAVLVLYETTAYVCIPFFLLFRKP
jgi:hypothetical protein